MTDSTGTRPRALVTGASSGIGQAFAERLARDGYDLIITARSRDRLEAATQQLRERNGVDVQVLVADLTEPAQLREVEQAAAEDAALELLINDAGYSAYMPFVELDPDVAENLIRLKVVAVTRLTRAALPGMIARGHGAISNVSSGLAFQWTGPEPSGPTPCHVRGGERPYERLHGSLAGELAGTGVQVQVLFPGAVDSPFQKDWIKAWRERMGRPQVQAGVNAMTPEQVVQASLAGLKLGELVHAPTPGLGPTDAILGGRRQPPRRSPPQSRAALPGVGHRRRRFCS